MRVHAEMSWCSRRPIEPQALQDVSRLEGPTRFLPKTHNDIAAHHALAQGEAETAGSESGGVRYCAAADSRVAVLSVGDATLFDSRLHHCGGPHLPSQASSCATARDAEAEEAPPVLELERVLFYVSFRSTTAASGMNADKHGAGSIRPELAARCLELGALRERR